LSACAKIKEEKSAKNEYQKGLEYIKNSNFIECSSKFDEIIDEFPFSVWSKESKILSAYCHYKEDSYIQVISLADDFITNYPSDKNIIYMQYLRAISYYKQMPDISRSQIDTKTALYGFRDVIARDNDTIYAKDAKNKIKIINENIAGYYMEIARFYEKNNNYVGAINNLNYVINNYSFTKQYPESLYRIYAIYYRLGIKDEAKKAKDLLEKLNLDEDNFWLKLIQNNSKN
jgi:outer membrane protein assembly factor BamD